MRGPLPQQGVVQVLFVCRANQCRSPFAAALAARAAAGDESLVFSSAGLLPGGRSMPSVGRGVAGAYDLDFSHHVSRELDVVDAEGFDLILTMGKDQSRDIVADNPDLWPRVFTLKQFTRWVLDHPRSAEGSVGEWIDVAAARRPRSDLIGADTADDVADPLREPAGAWRTMVRELTQHTRVLVRALSTPVAGSDDVQQGA